MVDEFIYIIYFDKIGQPERIHTKKFDEFLKVFKELVERTREMPEWIIRVYK